MTTTYKIPAPTEFKTHHHTACAIIAPLYLTLLGTAGFYTSQAAVRLADFTPTPIIRIVGTEGQRKTRSVSEILTRARTTLGLKMSEIAEIFGVSRTAAYDWLNGTIPKPEIVYKLQMLASYVDKLEESSANRTQIQAGRHLLNSLRAGQNLKLSLGLSEDRWAHQLPSRGLRDSITRRNSDLSSLSEIVSPVILESS